MRLFVAIPLPEEVKSQLLQLQEPIDGLRWSGKDQLHLTLRFIGETDKDTANTIAAYLRELVAPPFRMEIIGLGTFPKESSPRVIWAGIKENEKLTALQADIENVCQEAGLDPDNRSFKPHITLGRNKNADPDKVFAFINQYPTLDIKEIAVNSFNLYRSELTDKGAVYHVEESFRLREPG